MYGAVLGDIIGMPYEGGGPVPKDFPLFGGELKFTDDTIMTVAVAEALLRYSGSRDDKIRKNVAKSMRRWGLAYEWADYGAGFNLWLHTKKAGPYYSYGNGSAMRCSAAGWVARSLDEAVRLGGLTADVTHDHPEGIKGAQAAAAAIFIARDGSVPARERKAAIKDYVREAFGYNIWKGYGTLGMTGISCQQTVPSALVCVLRAEDFEEAVRLAVALGGDTDTCAAIAGSIAEPLFGIPGEMLGRARAALPEKMTKILDRI